ncbi:DUF6397 family protein [Streptomyces phaeofaciens JCM 4814]|uniref:Uncharacterized protein n=1 Tax=Streptomyces phaeofaciens TaxID=68254 RepID=A0A918LXP6_9ACTN|nr:DUF6397 family protein [Streptomyces phaeofaciens]GGT65537.1 hypothetical protein GCM10010226_49050 [Streptomyces phaeofaciens]
MSGNTVTHPSADTFTPTRAARELGLKRSEFDLAVHLGRITTVPDEGGGGRRVARAEISRLRVRPDHPAALRASVLAVGTGDAAAILEVPATRFTRLARQGAVVPVRFYLNRYRAVVWLYLAEELGQFAADESNAPLLKGRTPQPMRARLAEGLDLRPRNWRGRHLGFLLRQADGPWQRAGALAGFLDPVQIAEIVEDPYERSHLNRFRPGPAAHSAPGTPAAHLVEKITTADDPDEIGWLRSDLAHTLEEARAHQPAPRPTGATTRPGLARPAGRRPAAAPPAVTRSAVKDPAATEPAPSAPRPDHGPERTARGLLGRLRRRSA